MHGNTAFDLIKFGGTHTG